METRSLPRYNRKTTFRVKLVDRVANIGITVGGLGVIVAVLGLIAFIAFQVYPLFLPGEIGVAAEPRQLAQGPTLLLHTDEYRRVGVRVTQDGITCFAVQTGEVLEQFTPPELRGAKITAACITLNPRTKRKVGSALDVPHHHLLLGTDDGRVLVGELAYLTGFLRFKINEEPEDLKSLYMPEEKEFKRPEYIPQVVVRDNTVIEHLPSFGLYRTVQARLSVLRKLDFNTGGSAIRVLAGQISRGGADDDRVSHTLLVTADGRTLHVAEKIEVNMMTEELEADTSTHELTKDLAGVPAFALVNELQDALILATADGFVHHYQYDRGSRRFVLPHAPQNVFGAQADPEHGRNWQLMLNALRDDHGLEPVPHAPVLTAVNYLLGDDTIVFGDSSGGLQSWMTVMEEDFEAGVVWRRYTRARTLPPAKGAVRSIAAASLTKAALVVDESGEVRAINNTAERVYAQTGAEDAAIAIFNRKGDGLLAITRNGLLHHWWVDAPHSEVSFKSLFGAVWYESYPEPKYEWQSTGGTDDVEPKLSLMPLILGTIKGAIYALFFAVPLAVLAAIYTSEFMHRNMRAILKPTMEVMASLPSVVLGFLAALYFAPSAAPIMPTILCALVIVPGVFMVFGWVWQRCPPSVVGRFGYWRSTALLFALLAFGVWLSSMAGPRMEVLLFPSAEGANPALLDPVAFTPRNELAADRLAAGDFRTWPGGGQELKRDQEVGGVMLPKGWWIPGGHNLLVALLAIPLALLLGFGARELAFAIRKRKGKTPIDTLRERLEGDSGPRAVLVDLGFSAGFALILILLGVGLSIIITPLIETLFFSYDHPTAGRVADFRRFVTGTDGWKFEQTNSLVVGFAMGFAVIPLIYTISEDALTTVPNQLRAASLACGASRWQTTMRVVLPAAASGIFSGIVIGLGRALGETMIVVMAAGGTPVMELQPLNGFRSLSAAIAIEMPEAPHGGTLYRTLFLGGLVLFAMAFVINTMAEIVRMRLRKRLSRL